MVPIRMFSNPYLNIRPAGNLYSDMTGFVRIADEFIASAFGFGTGQFGSYLVKETLLGKFW